MPFVVNLPESLSKPLSAWRLLTSHLVLVPHRQANRQLGGWGNKARRQANSNPVWFFFWGGGVGSVRLRSFRDRERSPGLSGWLWQPCNTWTRNSISVSSFWDGRQLSSPTHIQKGSSRVRCGLRSGEALLAWAHTRLLAVKEDNEESLLLSSEMGSEAVGMGTLFQIRG